MQCPEAFEMLRGKRKCPPDRVRPDKLQIKLLYEYYTQSVLIYFQIMLSASGFFFFQKQAEYHAHCNSCKSEDSHEHCCSRTFAAAKYSTKNVTVVLTRH